jgi:hypothetical protein
MHPNLFFQIRPHDFFNYFYRGKSVTFLIFFEGTFDLKYGCEEV